MKVTDVVGRSWDMEGGKRGMRVKVLCAQPYTSGNDLKTHFIQGCDSEWVHIYSGCKGFFCDIVTFEGPPPLLRYFFDLSLVLPPLSLGK